MKIVLDVPDSLETGLLRWKNELNVAHGFDLSLEEWLVQHMADLALQPEIVTANRDVEAAMNEARAAEYLKARAAVLTNAGVPLLPSKTASVNIEP